MLNVSVQKEALKTLTGKDLCWVFVLTDKAAKAFLNTELSRKPVSPPGNGLEDPAFASSSSTSLCTIPMYLRCISEVSDTSSSVSLVLMGKIASLSTELSHIS